MTETQVLRKEAAVQRTNSRFADSLLATIVKIVLLGLVDAAAVFAVLVLIDARDWVVLAIVVAATIAINVIYLFRDRFLPAKYLAPGVVFLLVFQVFVVLFSVYIGFTNYGDGHISTKADAIESIQRNNQVPVPGSPTYPAGVAVREGTNGPLYLVIQDPATGQALAGSNEDPLVAVQGVEFNSLGAVRAAPGFRMLELDELNTRSAELRELSVPFSDDPAAGSLRTDFGSFAVRYTAALTYDPAADTFTDTEGVVYRDSGNGSFVGDNGKRLEPGWKINVGFGNFQRALTDESIRGPLIAVTAWTFAFAILSVLSTFALGLAMALLLNDRRIKGLKIYRTLMILPYAFPGFLSSLIWMGLMNQEFGFLNNVLFPGADIPWLTDPWWGKFSILMVNLWLGYPYMFLVATGALQSLPEEALEAARVDGASTWQIFRHVKLPLLMIPLAPLLISSFAFNFNNFGLVYFLTRGGPDFAGAGVNAGHTDLLITMVYKVAFSTGQGRDYGLASAFAIIIFIVVGLVSYLGFRQTRTLEDLN